MVNQPNAINYIELPAGGCLKEMKAFYGAAFGWQFQDWGDSYASFSAKQAGMEGGFDGRTLALREGATGGSPLVILYTDDLLKVQNTIEKAGGKIIKPIYEFPGGRRFHFADPAGNALAIWSEK